MRKISLISSYCDTQKKIDVLEKNIKTIKSNNLDVMVISPFYLPKNIVDLCDYFFVTKDNPVLDWPIKAMQFWLIVNGTDKTYRLNRTFPDYGFAGLHQVKQLSEIVINLNYDQFYHMIYDIKIDENVIEGFNSDKTFSIYPSKRGHQVWDVGLHYMIFNKENLNKFISQINLESYLNFPNFDAFEWLHYQKQYLNYTIEKTPIEDEIFFYENLDVMNYSPTEKFKFYVEKNNQTFDRIKLFFYDVPNPKSIKLKIDNIEFNYEISQFTTIDLGFNELEMKPVTMEVDEDIFNLEPIINKIKHNILEII